MGGQDVQGAEDEGGVEAGQDVAGAAAGQDGPPAGAAVAERGGGAREEQRGRRDRSDPEGDVPGVQRLAVGGGADGRLRRHHAVEGVRHPRGEHGRRDRQNGERQRQHECGQPGGFCGRRLHGYADVGRRCSPSRFASPGTPEEGRVSVFISPVLKTRGAGTGARSEKAPSATPGYFRFVSSRSNPLWLGALGMSAGFAVSDNFFASGLSLRCWRIAFSSSAGSAARAAGGGAAGVAVAACAAGPASAAGCVWLARGLCPGGGAGGVEPAVADVARRRGHDHDQMDQQGDAHPHQGAPVGQVRHHPPGGGGVDVLQGAAHGSVAPVHFTSWMIEITPPALAMAS